MKEPLTEKGFTLVEVMLALAVLTIGIMSMFAMQATSIKGNVSASTITTAANYSADRIEKIFAMDYDDLKDNEAADGIAGAGDGLNGLDHDTDATADGKDPNPPAGYEIYWNVAEDEPMPFTKSVNIIAVRTNRGEAKRVVFEYIKAEKIKK